MCIYIFKYKYVYVGICTSCVYAYVYIFSSITVFFHKHCRFPPVQKHSDYYLQASIRDHYLILLIATRVFIRLLLNPLSAKFIKWSNTLKQFVGKLPTNCLSVFDHFMNLALKGLMRLAFA